MCYRLGSVQVHLIFKTSKPLQVHVTYKCMSCNLQVHTPPLLSLSRIVIRGQPSSSIEPLLCRAVPLQRHSSVEPGEARNGRSSKSKYRCWHAMTYRCLEPIIRRDTIRITAKVIECARAVCLDLRNEGSVS